MSATIKCVGGPLDGQEVELDAGRTTFIVEENHPLLIDVNWCEYRRVTLPQNAQWICIVEGVVGVLREPDNHPGALAVLAMSGKLATCPIVADSFDAEQVQTTVRSYLLNQINPEGTVRIA